MLAAIDSGNSSIKLGIFIDGRLVSITNSVSIHEIPEIIKRNQINKIILSDTGGRLEKIITALSSHGQVMIVTPLIKLPFRIRYNTPDSLGTDRISAVAGAWNRYAFSDILVIDAGTCITYDFIDREGNYWGGGISPGVDMRLKSLNSFTAKLPEVNVSDNYDLVGRDTTASILSGTIGGIVEELKGMIENYRRIYPEIKIILCGGSSGFFESKIKDSIFVIPDLVLWGLWAISEKNEI
jgi:type III pantothenate kinase